MKKFVMELKLINRSRKALLAGVLVLAATLSLHAQQAPPEGSKFEIVSVKVLNNKEAAERSPDFIGPNVAIRLRLSSTSAGLSFYGWKNSAIPAGYKIQRRENELVWLYGKGGTEKRTSSPGLKAVLFGSVGEWITLPAHSSIEWEELDSTSFAGEEHSFTAFIKQRDVDQAMEIVSSSTIIPSGPESPKH